MYGEKIESILEDLEDKNLEIAGGAMVGINLASINSLIIYITNLTLGKKKYENVQDNVQEILKKAEELKTWSLRAIDGDKIVLENILDAYKNRNENEQEYIEACKEAVDFCMEVLNIAFETLKLSYEISLVGNKMLASDFEICKNYAYASVKSAIVNVKINLNGINDEEYKKLINDKCIEITKEAKNIYKR